MFSFLRKKLEYKLYFKNENIIFVMNVLSRMNLWEFYAAILIYHI